MTEKELMQTWCPYARVPLSIVQNIRGMAGGATDTISINRNVGGTVPAAARCIGRACSQFREVVHSQEVTKGEPPPAPHATVQLRLATSTIYETRDGYCGAAGRP